MFFLYTRPSLYTYATSPTHPSIPPPHSNRIIIMVDLLDVCRNYFGPRNRCEYVLFKFLVNKIRSVDLNARKNVYLNMFYIFFLYVFQKHCYSNRKESKLQLKKNRPPKIIVVVVIRIPRA